MRISIHQPDYIPWLGFYYKVAHSDLFVYLDDAQYSNEAGHNVNSIKTPQGVFRLKIPVEQHLGDLICAVRTKDELHWKEKHLKTIEMNYKKAAYFDAVFPGFRSVLTEAYGNISELNMAVNQYILDGFGIRVPIRKTSELPVQTVREERILDVCEMLGADEYYSGNGARAYQKEEHFLDRGIKLTYLDYLPIEYKQLWPKVGFMPCMSALDYIFNCGFDWDTVEKCVRDQNEAARMK